MSNKWCLTDSVDSDGDTVVDSLDYAPEDPTIWSNLSNLPVTVTVLTTAHTTTVPSPYPLDGYSNQFYYKFQYEGGSSGSNEFTEYQMVLDEDIDVEILMVGGGGAGGYSLGTGGGAGGLVYIPMVDGYSLSSGTYKIRVGAGGSGMDDSKDTTGAQSRGTDSSLTLVDTSTEILTAVGGANGNGQSVAYTPLNVASHSGGSGAGGVRHQNSPGNSVQKTFSSISSNSRTYGYGNSGGNGITYSPYSSGGGGGAGSAGKDGTNSGGGDGGDGMQLAITGQNVWYAAGGGGHSHDSGMGAGGSGIGGNAVMEGNGNNGTDHTGSGGGGSYVRGGYGGSGIVIIRIKTN